MASASNSVTVYAPASSSYGYVIGTSFVENSTSTANNTSNITITATLRGDKINFSGQSSSTLQAYWYDNKRQTNTLIASGAPGSTTKGVTYSISGTIDAPHNNDGTLSGYAYTVWTKNSSNSYVPPTTTVQTATTNLTTIPRASSVSMTNADIGKNSTITISKASSSFTTTLTYAFGSLSGTIVTKTANSSVTWTIPTSFYAQIPNSPSGQGTVTAITYSGNTEIGRKSTTFTATANKSSNSPTVSITSVIDTNNTTKALTGNEQILIKGYSTARVSISKSAKNSATISSVYVNNTSIGTTATYRDIANISTNTFSASVTDSRGYTGSASTSKTGSNYVNYVPLTLSATFTRNTPVDGKINLTYSGNYFNGSFGATNNTLTVRYRYKESSASTYGNWITLNPTISGNSFSQTIEPLTGTFNYQTQYDFQIQAIDEIYTSGVTLTKTVSEGLPIYWWNRNTFNINGTLKVNNKSLLDLVYPVGAIYISVNSTNPSTLFGGTWTAFATGRTLVGIDTSQTEFNTVQKTGGSKYLQKHGHGTINYVAGYSNDGIASDIIKTVLAGSTASTAVPAVQETGTGNSGNLQPYITVYMWKRTA